MEYGICRFASVGSGCVERQLGLVRAAAKDRSGAIAPIFAGMLSFLTLLTAMAIDAGRWAVARNELQASIDAAVLAGAAALRQPNATDAKGIEMAKKALAANKAQQRFAGDISTNIQFTVEGNSVKASGTAGLDTVIGKVFGIDTLPLLGTTSATGLQSQVAAVAAFSNSTFELSLMLDITGSMCNSAPDLDDAPCTSGTKLTAMKTAASDLVKTMLTDQLKSRVRIAVVPFSDGVRLPALPRLAAAGLTPLPQTFSQSYNYEECTGSGRNKHCVTKTAYNYYYYHPTECVAERMGTDKYTDAAPGPGNYVMTMMRRTKGLLDVRPDEFGCTLGSSSVVMPLTNDKDALLTTINGLAAKGGTAGHLGTAWAWYTLSPNWKDVWAGTANDPAPYPVAGDAKLKKIAILMTDGEYNNQFSEGGYRLGSWAYNSNKINGSSPTQAQALCSGMKAQGIEVYTIGYDVGTTEKAFLKTCATDAAHAFTADTAAQLATAFQNIGRQVLSLHLSQ
jgi:Flp pilus assembly protein TadG